jgi:ABC-type transport system involved in Fe-S cluster assembly fused permease/ATPase subunit
VFLFLINEKRVILVITAWITEYRTRFRRQQNVLDYSQRAKAVDSLLNFETVRTHKVIKRILQVKYYNGEDFEIQRYDVAILKFQVCYHTIKSIRDHRKQCDA